MNSYIQISTTIFNLYDISSEIVWLLIKLKKCFRNIPRFPNWPRIMDLISVNTKWRSSLGTWWLNKSCT